MTMNKPNSKNNSKDLTSKCVEEDNSNNENEGKINRDGKMIKEEDNSKEGGKSRGGGMIMREC